MLDLTGLPESDVHTAALVKELLTHPSVLASCPVPFDEARMWKGEDGLKKRQELMTTFRNITQIMDCVGCEKCKLWGKLQVGLDFGRDSLSPHCSSSTSRAPIACIFMCTYTHADSGHGDCVEDPV